ncbi:MAG: hypothetical protein MR321_00930 [Bacteroides sp.]|jgi:hypothetical protein|nr:hypothetical protein [Bacteroides sp.]
MKYRRPDAVANDTELVVNGTDVTDVFEREVRKLPSGLQSNLKKMRPTVFCLSAFCIFV